MKEHPIPQDIVGYRFHIVGNMTIKQFAEIGVGVFLAFILYQTNLLTIIKWPLMALSVAVGAALAFVPFEERPLDHWLFTFVRVLYRPTKYYWRRHAKVPDLFSFEPKKTEKNQPIEVDLTPARRERIKEYMLSVRSQQPDTFDQERQQSISDILTTFSEINVSSHAEAGKAKPRLKIRVRSLGSDREDSPTQPQTPAPVDEATAYVTQLYAEVLDEIPLDQAPIAIGHTQLDVSQVAQNIAVPEQTTISVDAPAELDTNSIAPNSSESTSQPTTYTQLDSNVLAAPTTQTLTDDTTFNQDLPFPVKPTQPNKLVGMVLSPTNELINDAIVEIKDQNSRTLRAVKTNALGQFFVTTPLADGSYILETEKDGLTFSPTSLTLTGTVIEPIEIRSLS